MGAIESIGLLKFDFSLKTLTVIEKTLRYIKDSGTDLYLRDVPLDGHGNV